jgi:AcrR family transcriptional regulator
MTDWLVIVYHVPRVAAKDREAYAESQRARILEAALRLIGDAGFDATTVEAIAREAGISKGTLYLYFESKLAMLEELIRRRSLVADVERLAKAFLELPLEQAVPILVRTAWKRLRQSEDLVRVLMREMPNHPEIASHFVQRAMLPANTLFASFLEARLGARRAPEVNTLVAGRALVGMVLALFITQEILGGRELMPLSEDEIVATISRLFLHGVLKAEPAA